MLGAKSMLLILSDMLVFGCWGLSDDEGLIRHMTALRPSR